MAQLLSAFSTIANRVPFGLPQRGGRGTRASRGTHGKTLAETKRAGRVVRSWGAIGALGGGIGGFFGALGNTLSFQHVRPKHDLRDMGFFYASLGTALVFVTVVCLYLWCRVATVNIGYEMSVLNASSSLELERNKRLRVELTRLKSPERLERIGRETGLVYPTGKQVVRVR